MTIYSFFLLVHKVDGKNILWSFNWHFGKSLDFNYNDIVSLLFCVGKAPWKKTSGKSEATSEDLAFPSRSLRESDGVRRRGCIEHGKNKGVGSGLT
jgi:hypothetical protein